MKKSIEREYLIDLIVKNLDLNIANCEFMKKAYRGNQQVLKVINKSIKNSEKALESVHKIKHIEILRAIYSDIIGQISAKLMLSGSLVVSKKVYYWDNTENGFKEFQELCENNIKEQEQKIKEQQESLQAVQKAKEQGKKVQMIYDPTTKKVKPVIEESENNNA